MIATITAIFSLGTMSTNASSIQVWGSATEDGTYHIGVIEVVPLEVVVTPGAHKVELRAAGGGRARLGAGEVAALWPLATYATMTGQLVQGVTLAEQALSVARRVGDPLFLGVAHHHLG